MSYISPFGKTVQNYNNFFIYANKNKKNMLTQNHSQQDKRSNRAI